MLQVAPHTGAWIETPAAIESLENFGRTPHGCVD